MDKFQKTYQINGKEVKVTIGNFGYRADSTVMLQEGETVVMAFVTVSKGKSNLDYFPLGVNYIEKFYAGGVISGSRFKKREGRPSDEAIVKGRVIDRGIRPLFPKEFKREVSVTINLMSYDDEHDPQVLAANAAALALHISSVPFNGPIGFVRIGMDENESLVINPSEDIKEVSKLNSVISSTRNKITQLEVEAKEIDNSLMSEVFAKSLDSTQAWLDMMDEVRAELGKEKIEVEVENELVELQGDIEAKFKSKLNDALFDDENRNNRLDEITNEVIELYQDQIEDQESQIQTSDIKKAIDYISKKITRENLLSGKRLSGRSMDEIREIEIEASYLPRVHGSAMFRRGQSQGLAITTLGSLRLVQLNESFDGESEKRYMHHYSGPNYSYGEAGRFNFYPGNRELGHGALAEKAVEPVLPSQEEFPYTIRVVTEILSQNGSTSMAATCASCLSLMDAGVPIKRPVAGISIGLIVKDDEQREFALMTDVQDVEDYYGDMDFKVAGTRDGITAIQMDTKLEGVSVEILQKALEPALNARLFILDKYNEVLANPRTELSKYAPRVTSLKINPEKIGELIGPGGKNIKAIMESVKNEVDVDINDDGTINITGVSAELVDMVVTKIKLITDELEIGKIYEGVVERIEAYGAFVKIGGTSGLVHVSELADGFVKDVKTIVKLGDKISVKVVGRNDEGKIQLSAKQAK
jgi:polyribonucleotide nucleotidyltransferase